MNQTNLKTLTINDKIQIGADFYRFVRVEHGLARCEHTTSSNIQWLNAAALDRQGFKRAGVK